MQNSRKKYIIVDTIIVILATVFTGVYYYYIEKGFPPYFDELANFAKYNQMIADGKLTNLHVLFRNKLFVMGIYKYFIICNQGLFI